MKKNTLIALSLCLAMNSLVHASSKPIIKDNLVFQENNGLVAVETEHFYKQTHTEKRSWQMTSSSNIPDFQADGDPAHIQWASSNAYLEILPDSPRKHGEKSIYGENVSNEPGKLGILSPTSVPAADELPSAFAAVKEAAGKMIKAKPNQALVRPRQADGDGSVKISGELRQWHKVTLTLDGPFAHEGDHQPNPFTDHQFNVRFTHSSGSPDYLVPGYFAADGSAENSSATSGNQWRAHLSPDYSDCQKSFPNRANGSGFIW
jgi:hypothetical protein